ncbi:MAG: hypothetical protein LiPW30_720, partial [Parcubacteria group bacterium LiPW_30]
GGFQHGQLFQLSIGLAALGNQEFRVLTQLAQAVIYRKYKNDALSTAMGYH